MVYGKQEGSLPTNINRRYKNSNLQTRCISCRKIPTIPLIRSFVAYRRIKFKSDSLKRKRSLEQTLEGGNSRLITRLVETRVLGHSARTRDFFFFFFTSIGTYNVPLGNESCAATYFGGTEFAIARESGRQWPASAARDQTVRFAWLQHCTVKGQTQSNARTPVRSHVCNPSSLSRHFYGDGADLVIVYFDPESTAYQWIIRCGKKNVVRKIMME